jgi:RsiW-degrading membrane proteinase PrsW (M82 family)
MPPSARRTSTLRVVLALLFAYVLPSLVLGQAFYWTQAGGEPKTAVLAAMFSAPALVMGLLLGWPYVLGAAGCWAVLDHFNRHYVWAAAIVGLAAGMGVSMTGLRSSTAAHLSFSLVLGLVTGLGVWWIAYGRQDRLPVRASPKPRLAL